jgi:hypothetical protein
MGGKWRIAERGRALPEDKKDNEPLLINEIQLLLAEKRTSLAALRSGITVFVLPLSVVSFLIATSKYYDIFAVIHLLAPLLLLCLLLAVLGTYLVLRAVFRIHRYDNHIAELKKKNARIARFMD